MRITHVTSIVSLAVLAPFAAACGASPSGGPADEHASTSSVNVALTQVPKGVACIEIDVTGSPNVTQRFDVTAGQSSVLTVGGLPAGGVDISGAAYAGPCYQAIGATATWITQSVAAVLAAGQSTDVTLTFAPAAGANIGVDFEGTTYRNVTTFAGTARTAGTADGVGTAALFNRPQMMTSDGTNLYVSDGKNRTIRQIAIATATVTTLAGNPNATGPAVDGVGSAAVFTHPEGIAYDGAGNLYVADVIDHTIRKIAIASKTVTTIAGAAGQSGSADGAGTAARFNSPYGVASDGAHVFVVDGGNGTIREITVATGAVTTIAGTAGQSGSADGIGAAARFTSPTEIATDGSSLYVTDGSTVRQIVLGNNQVWTIAGDPATTGAADGYTPHFGSLYGITFDGQSNLFVTDIMEHNVRQIALDTGLTTTVAGSPDMTGTKDGLGPAAQFILPLGIASDGHGNVFVSETSVHTIRKLTPAAN